MELQASFSFPKRKRSYFAVIYNLLGEGTTNVFHFDTGASISLIGLNTICGDDPQRCEALKSIILDEIKNLGVLPYQESLQTVTQDELIVYPCKCEGVFIQGSAEITFYFHVYLGNISLPLLGFDYIDDCSFKHSIRGNLFVQAVANDVGKRFYPDKVVDFNKVIRKYNDLI